MRDRKKNTVLAPAGLLGASAIVLALTVAPVSLSIDEGEIALAAPQALAMGNGGGNGNGNGGGNGNGNGGGNGGGKDKSDTGGGPGNSGKDKPGKGSSLAGDGFGPGNSGKAKEKAKGRYEKALAGLGRGPNKDDGSDDVGSEEATLTDEATEALVAVGWGSGKTYDSGAFKNHGEQVKTYVEIAKELGYSGHVGSLQANFGSPYLGAGEPTGEDLSELAVLEEDAVEGDPEPESEAAAEGDTGGSLHWSEVNLDVNGDGAITKADLQAALAASAAGGSDGEETSDSGADGEVTDGVIVEGGDSGSD